MTRGVKSGRVCSGGKAMTDPMQEMVCPRCGTDDIHETETWFGPVWCCWNCDGEPCEPEPRASYLAGVTADRDEDGPIMDELKGEANG